MIGTLLGYYEIMAKLFICLKNFSVRSNRSGKGLQSESIKASYYV